jgi:polyisoprenoid-binding protein YceI
MASPRLESHRLLRSWWFRIPVAVLAVVVIAIAGLGAFWWFAIREDAEPATSAPEIPADLSPVASPTAAAVSLPEGVTRWVVVSERSKASYFAGETLASLGLPSTAEGTTSELTGEFYLSTAGLDTTVPSTFTVDLRNLSTDQSRRDRRVQGALETSRFPTAT